MGNRRRAAFAALFVVALCAAVFATAGIAVAADNSACLSCHAGTMNWTVGAVNKTTACPKCHVSSLANTHPYHNPGSNCAGCHPGWGASTPAMTPGYSGGNGAFVSAASENATSGDLHLIHAQVTWIANASKPSQYCASCHTVAACTACHNGTAPASIHATHSASGVCQPSGNTTYPARTPWSGRFGYGVTGGNLIDQTDAAVNNQCSIPECHDTTGLNAKDPVVYQESAATLSGTWGSRTYTAYSAGQMRYANATNAQVSYTFTGQSVAIVTDTDPYRGIADIIVDGVTTATVDLYSATTKYQVEAWRSPNLSAGSHTIALRVTGTKNALSRGTYTVIDGFKIWPVVTASVAPPCASCHPDRVNPHGRTWSHESSQATGLYSGYACYACHQVNASSTPSGNLDAEHNRTTSSSYGLGCTNCHTTYAPMSITATTARGGCSYGTCHVAPRAAHTASATAHVASTATADSLCKTCHSGDDTVVHNNSITYNTPVTNCLTCHGTTKYPTSNSCTSGCHTRYQPTGITNMNTHIVPSQPSHVASPTDAGVNATHSGGKTCATCHLGFTLALNIADEHAKASSLTSASGVIDCNFCHTVGYMPAPGTWTDKCTACHATGKAGVPASSTATAYTTDHNFATWNSANNTSCGTLNGSSCHDVTMADAIHNSANPGNGDCTSCHTTPNAPPTAHLCSDCHAGSPYHSATVPASAHDASTQSECLSCHANKANISTGHASCATCHSSTTLIKYLKNNYTAACTDCHATGAGKLGSHAYTPANPNHYSASPTHTASAMDTTIDATYSYDVQCQSCHSATLVSAHTTTTARLDSAHTSWGPNSATAFCVSCHSSTYAEANAVTVVASGWTPNTCDECHVTHGNGKHTTYSTAHTATVGTAGVADNCGTAAACHGTDRNVRRIHNRATSGCNATGSDSKGWSGSCHAIDKDMFGTPMSCGSGSGGCHTSHTNSNHGVSSGAMNCLTGCHGGDGFSNMVSSTASYHHVLDAAIPGTAPATGSYPTSNNSLACVSCHTDHNYFNSARGANLRTNVASTAGSAATNTDFIATSGYGICVSCHSVAQAKSTSQSTLTSQSAQTTTITGANYGAGKHNYSVATSFGAAGTDVFNANCSKCHDDEQDAASKMTGTYKIGTHYSAEARLLGAMGVTIANTRSGAAFCYECHSRTANAFYASGKDGYNASTMTTRALGIEVAFSGAYSHPVTQTVWAHHTDETTGAADLLGAGIRHVTCEDCHDAHEAQAGTHTTGTAAAGLALKGALGVIPKYTGVLTDAPSSWTLTNLAGSAASYEAYVCFRCHSSSISTWASNAPTSPSGNFKETDLASEFSTMNAGGHNVLGQSWPLTTWNATTYSQSGAGSWPTPATGYVNGWTSTSKMTCSDCHTGASTTAARGPHGSTQKFMLDPAYTTQWSTATGATIPTTLICAKCHATALGDPHNATGSHSVTCTSCHVAVPHGWKRPRLLVYSTDKAPYNNGNAQLSAYSLTITSPWQETNCYRSGGCGGKHSSTIASAWK